MDPILIILLMVAAVVVVAVWVGISLIAIALRIVVWMIGVPLKIVGGSNRRACGSRRLAASPGNDFNTPSADEVMTRTASMQCGNDKCSAPLPDVARYCPRCGAGVRRTNGLANRRFVATARVA